MNASSTAMLVVALLVAGLLAAAPASKRTPNVQPARKAMDKPATQPAAEACSTDPNATCGTTHWKDKTDAEWRKLLTPEQYRIARTAATERPFTGKYWNTKTPGTYHCAACNQPLFSSETKFESGTGWPSFWKPLAENAVTVHVDRSHGMVRAEVKCSQCGAHLGHVFEDGPPPTGLRYCMNSAVLKLVPADLR